MTDIYMATLWEPRRGRWRKGVGFCLSSVVLELHDKVDGVDPLNHKELWSPVRKIQNMLAGLGTPASTEQARNSAPHLEAR